MDNIQGKKLPVTRIQKLIGTLMLQSKRRCPYCYLESSADITDLTAMRKKYSKSVGVRVTTNDFFCCAIARAIEKFPLMAGSLDKSRQNIVIADGACVGFAVAAPQGLVVPVIKDAADKPLPQMALDADELLKKARSNKLMPDDLYGANVVLTSLGMYGISSFFAIAPPGSTAIISIGKIENSIIPVAGEMTRRKVMSVALAVDRSIVDETYAAKFLKCVIEQVQNPQTVS